VTASRILIAGVGNVFLGDDGFGVEVVSRLAGRPLPPGVRVADFGIRGLDLAYALLDGYDLVVLVDASRQGGIPGTVYLLEVEHPPEREAPRGDSARWEAHGMIPTQALGAARAMGAVLQRVVVVACEPETFGPPGVGQMGLSRRVTVALDEAVRLIETVVQRQVHP
jgi:hydrogenase maturation protease